MAKLIIRRAGDDPRTVVLTKERMTIGRLSHNDILLPHPTVSGEHAVIVSLHDDCFLEDLSSTNGTFVNGHRIGKHLLKNKDQITLAKFKIEFVADGVLPAVAAATMPGPYHSTLSGHIRVLNGTNAGKLLPLNKPQTTLGRAGVQVVVINRGTEAYTITLVEGQQQPLVNGQPIGTMPHRLYNGDVIELTGTQMVFTLG